MDDKKPPEQQNNITAGQEFVKRIGPAGMALFLLLAVLVTAICLTTGRDPIPGYQAPQTTAYYAEHPDELVAELEANVFPALPDYVLTAAAEEDGTVAVAVEEGNFVAARAALLRSFDESLFTFIE